MSKRDYTEIGWEATNEDDEIIDGFERVAKMFGGYVYLDPRYEGSDMQGVIVSTYKMTKRELKEIEEELG